MSTLAQNCWEFRQCGREPGGINAVEFGACPAAMDSATDGVWGGVHRGRMCWAVTGTLCGGTPATTFAQKRRGCRTCEFLQQVKQQRNLRGAV